MQHAEGLETGEARAEGRGRIVVSSDITETEWDRFVESRPDASAYHQWRWRTVIERGLGHRGRYFAARLDGRVVGVLPTAEVWRPLVGSALSSLPYVNYGGVLAEDAAAASALADHARRVVADERFAFLILRHRQRVFSDLPVRAHKQTMIDRKRVV